MKSLLTFFCFALIISFGHASKNIDDVIYTEDENHPTPQRQESHHDIDRPTPADLKQESITRFGTKTGSNPDVIDRKSTKQPRK